MAAPRKKPSNLNAFYVALGLIALVGAGWLIYSLSDRGSDGTATDMVDLAIADDPRALYERAEPVSVGSTEAPVKLVVFSDYMCPWCGRFRTQVEPLVHRDFIEPGRVQLVYYDFPLGGGHRHSFLAARAARCAGQQNRFWEYHDVLFGQQSRWATKDNVSGDLVDYARQVGLDVQTFQQCLRSDAFAETVTANRLLGEQLGVNATPTVFVNGKRIQNPMNYSELRQAIERELAA